MILFRAGPKAVDAATQPIGQSTAMLIMIMIIGITAVAWYTRYLRSRAGLLTIAMIVAILAYFAFWTNPVTAP